MSRNIIFFGTPAFAVHCLKKIVTENFKVIAVVTAPDKPSGRGRQLRKSAVKEFSETHECMRVTRTRTLLARSRKIDRYQKTRRSNTHRAGRLLRTASNTHHRGPKRAFRSRPPPRLRQTCASTRPNGAADAHLSASAATISTSSSSTCSI